MNVSRTEVKKCRVIQVMKDKEFTSTSCTILLFYIMAETATGGFLDLTLCEKCPNTEFFLVRIFPHSD